MSAGVGVTEVAVLLAHRRTTAGEPHRLRRRRLLAAHPEIKALFGFDPWPKVRMAVVLALQLGLAAGVAACAPRLGAVGFTLVFVGLAYVVGAVLAHYGGVIIHEAAHDLCASTSRRNRAVALFANFIQLVPYAMTFRRHHMTHHRFMGVVGTDNDLAQPAEQRWVGNSAARKLLWLAGYPLVGGFLRGYAQRPDRWEVLSWLLQAAFVAAVLATLGPWALAYLGLSAYLSGSLHPIAGHFIHEHYLWDEGQETYSYYGVLNRVTLNMGHHVEHHDFVGIPGSRLPALHQMAPEFYQGLVAHRSWTAILWRFVSDRSLSHYARFERSRADVGAHRLETMIDFSQLRR